MVKSNDEEIIAKTKTKQKSIRWRVTDFFPKDS